MGAVGKYDWPEVQPPAYIRVHKTSGSNPRTNPRRRTMKTWMKPSVREQEVGLEVTSYLPAEIDLI